jgi:hypothetical protein
MAEVEVRLVRADGTPGPSAPVYSDDRGAFRLWGLARGRYRVCATAHNRFLESRSDGSRFVRTCHLASTSESTAVDVVLEDEDATGIDIRVQRAGTYTASGSVTDAAGSPVDGAFVGALRDDREVSGHATTQGGQFVLKGLVPGRYLLHAGVGGPADPGDLRPPARDRELGFATFVVDGSDVSGVDVPLSKGRTVAGRIVFDGGRPPRASSLRIVVQTRAADPAWGMTAGRPPFSPVDDKLQFELKELFQLPLVVGLDGVPEGWATKEIQFDGHDVIDLPVNFGAASSRARLDIVLTNRVAATAVRVADEQGAPVTSYQVVILPADANRWKAALWHVPGMPSRDGELKLGPRVPGDYLLAALPQEDYHVLLHKPARLASIAAAARRVTLVEGENRIVELRLTRLPVTQQ